jgi:hypothetical protein
MKRLVYLHACLLALLLVTTSTKLAHAQRQETRACEFQVKGRCVSGQASVTLAGGVVTKLEVGMFWCGRSGNLGYSCTIDSSRDDGESVWSEEAGATVIANPSPFNPNEPDQAKVTVGRYVSIDLEKAQSLGRCGVGAELPRAIVIPARGKTCRAWLRAN